MSDADIEAHGRDEHRAAPKRSCPVCLLDWASLIHRDLDVPPFDKRRLATVKLDLDRRRPWLNLGGNRK